MKLAVEGLLRNNVSVRFISVIFICSLILQVQVQGVQCPNFECEVTECSPAAVWSALWEPASAPEVFKGP